MLRYLTNRAKERDTQVVLLGAAYAVGRSFVPAEYVMLLDAVASLAGISYAATPSTPKK